MPLSPIGRSRNVARYRGSINGSTRVYLAGDYMGMPFTEGAAETGKWAAEALIKNLA
jgi:oxygen-dependent protoporphyrinogen oxidase